VRVLDTHPCTYIDFSSVDFALDEIAAKENLASHASCKTTLCNPNTFYRRLPKKKKKNFSKAALKKQLNVVVSFVSTWQIRLVSCTVVINEECYVNPTQSVL